MHRKTSAPWDGRVPTREECIAAAAAILIRAVGRRAAMTPREAAEAAYYPGHPLGTVEAIEAEIIRRRAIFQVPLLRAETPATGKS